ncbi:MAG: N-acetylmuramoyl-L-alanine amidase [Clostridia bacterium]|nr:N-acetylmuramoyl-L-alanine amidase [Clostridia bacterium]
MIKIAINAGHTLSGAGTGANGYINESKETRKIVKALIPILKKKGFAVVDATVDTALTQNTYLRRAVDIANNSKADLFLSIHFNAGGGKGCECYTWKGKKVKQAVNINEELKSEGFRNRGIKDGSKLYVIKKTNMTAILLEVCFVDSKTDYELYKRLGAETIAHAIADGIAR